MADLNLNNFRGYCLAYRDETPPKGSGLKRHGEWQTLVPLVIYPELRQLIDAVPDFDRKKHLICEVTVHILGERVEVLGEYGLPDELQRPGG